MLRDEIAKLLEKKYDIMEYGAFEPVADSILTLPSGVESVKDDISRDVTILEAVQFAKLSIEYQPDKTYALPNGEIYRVKKER